MRNSGKVKIYVTLCVVLLSCKYSFSQGIGNNSIESCIVKNIVDDFAKKQKSSLRKHDTFEISYIYCESDELNCIRISPLKNEHLLLEIDSIGSSTGELFTDFISIKKKLFFWVNPKKKVNYKTLQMMSKYKLIDSSYYNVTTTDGVFSTKEYSKDIRTYIYCKSNFKGFISIRGDLIKNKDLSAYVEKVCDEGGR